MGISSLPQLPAPHAGLAKYIAEHPQDSIVDIIEPYRQYEAQLRTVFAQDRQNPALQDPYINVLPLFSTDTKLITARARDLASETDEEKSKYIMPLPEDKRRAHGSPAVVANHAEFQSNFNVFSESSLVDLDWNNVVAAGSSVVNCVLPVPGEFETSKRKLREYYHDKFCPASDVDLFLYGLTHEEAIEKIKQIERSVKDALLHEVTVVRTKYAITIASQHPVRHIQIVLRVYESISEILTGFDIDAAGGAYDGRQVYTTPRALASFITQINHVDLSRRSPSYENRLSKYSHRNFEVYWPDLNRSRIDPTIYERSFQCTLGLARLLVLERLPTTSARETYLNTRRQERGRPQVYPNRHHRLFGNIKDYHEDEVADWLSDEDVSNYHTFTVPYGPKFHAKKIEKLCYTRDLLLNAEWNQPKEREVYLHRHPAFFGRVEDVINDCCGSCPKPVTPEEIEVAEKEAEIYISGKVSFLIDDPGRQQIGSFNPLTDQDWTDMAYVGNTARLCQSIVNGDVEDVENWLSHEEADPNTRDYTGRTPLQLAVICSTAAVVRCLVDNGARLTARLADGKTALHLAAQGDKTEMIKILMEKSVENEEAEDEKQDRRRQAAKSSANKPKDETLESDKESDEDSDGELITDGASETDIHSIATGSFVKVKKSEKGEQPTLPEDNDDEPDFYKIDVLAWDVPCSPLHLAIAEGHEEAVKLLCDFGADSILPVKFINKDNHNDNAAILTLSLALSLPLEKAKSMARLLLRLGATCSQADVDGRTAFHQYVNNNEIELVDVLDEDDKSGVKNAINHLVFSRHAWSGQTSSPLLTAIANGNSILVLKLLNEGALAQIDFDTWLKAAKVSPSQSKRLGTYDANQTQFKEMAEQPLIAAIRHTPEGALALLQRGADANTLTSETHALLKDEYRRSWTKGKTALDVTRERINSLSSYSGEDFRDFKPNQLTHLDEAVEEHQRGTYARWFVTHEVEEHRKSYRSSLESYEQRLKEFRALGAPAVKKGAIEELIGNLKKVEVEILKQGGKTFDELHPDIKTSSNRHHYNQHQHQPSVKKYEFSPSFRGENDISDRRQEGYLDLMEAAWKGDISSIKALTLQAWGANLDQPPLKMAIEDRLKNTPFSLAFLRGHLQAARAILEIIQAQWSPPDQDKLRYRMEDRNDEDDEYDSADDDSQGDDENPRIVSEKADKTFTIDDVGRVSMQVKSHVKPLSSLFQGRPTFSVDGDKVTDTGTRELFIHAMDQDNVASLRFLLEIGQHYAEQHYEQDADFIGHLVLSESIFTWAIGAGKIEQLSLLIKRTGVGLPLEHLVKKSGVAVKEKPRFYQGLTVYGKKRKDWATAGRGLVSKPTGKQLSPLIRAVWEGNIDSAEFFLGDAPHRLYSEFGKSKTAQNDARLKHLKESPGGFDRAISKWLTADSELTQGKPYLSRADLKTDDFVIHCAVQVMPSVEASDMLKYLIEACPASLEKRNGAGDTPLMAACRLGRVQFVQVLLDAGADQSVRNMNGENIIHAALQQHPAANKLQELMDLLDPDLRSYLLQQRKNLAAGGATPLHTWMQQVAAHNAKPYSYYHWNSTYWPRPDENKVQREHLEVLDLLLGYSNGQGLELFDGAGDTCLHNVIVADKMSFIKKLIDLRPELLFRENAVGRTPAEVAQDGVTAEKFQRNSFSSLSHRRSGDDVHQTSPDDFQTEAVARSVSEDVPREQLHEAAIKLGLSGAYTVRQVAGILSALGQDSHSWGLRLEDDETKHVIWDLCKTAMGKNPSKRRLVSLNEANDVARRLGEQFTTSRYFSVKKRSDEDDEAGSDAGSARVEDAQDFVDLAIRERLHSAWKDEEPDPVRIRTKRLGLA